jgi:hypothetical protein
MEPDRGARERVGATLVSVHDADRAAALEPGLA